MPPVNYNPTAAAYRRIPPGSGTVRWRLQWGDLPDTLPLTRRLSAPTLTIESFGSPKYFRQTITPTGKVTDTRDVVYDYKLPWPGRYRFAFQYSEWEACCVWVDTDESAPAWTDQIVTGSAIERLTLAASSATTLPTDPNGGVTAEQVNEAIAAALATVSQGTLTQEQIDAIIAAIPDAPVTVAQVEALEQQVGYLTGLNIQGTFEVLAEWRQAAEELFGSLAADKADKVELQALSDYLNALNVENTLQVFLDWKPQVEEAVSAIDNAVAGKADLVNPAQEITAKVLRTAKTDGTASVVVRGYGMGADDGLYVWGADGKVIGRVLTTADGAGDSTVTVHADTELPQPTAMPFTPRDLIAAWDGYEPGLHLFTKGSATTLVTLGRLTEDGNVELRLSVMGDATNHAVIRDWGNGSSWFMRQEGLQIVYLESPKGDAPFGMPTAINLAGMAADVQAVGFAGMAETQAAMADTIRATESLTEMLTPGEWKPLVLGAGVTPNGVAQYRHNAGRIELRGEIKFTTRSTYFGGAATLPPEARPEVEHVQPAAMREDGVAPRTGYVTVQANGNLNFNPTGTVNRVSFGGIWWPEPGFTGPQTKPAPADD